MLRFALIDSLSMTASFNVTLGRAALQVSKKAPPKVAASVEDMPRLTAPSVSPPLERTMPGSCSTRRNIVDASR
jgi:hypothetical protein